jgi:hypothetical protein
MDRRTLILGGGAAAVALGAGAASFAGMGSGGHYTDVMSALRAPLPTTPDVREIVRYATLAPNGHNTQPWRFKIAPQSIRISPDFSRRTPAVDPDDHHLYVSLGCAAENLALAARSRGLIGEPRFDASGEGAVHYDYKSSAEQSSPLCEAIPQRQSTRAEFDGRPAAAADLSALIQSAAIPGVDLSLITNRAEINQVRDLVIAGNDIQMADRAFMAEFKHWMRFNPRTALKHGDGLYSACSGNPALPDWLGPAMFDLVFKPETENDKYARQLATSAGLAVFWGQRADPAHWFAVGRACQRFALQATALGMKLSFINQPVEVASLRPALASLIGESGVRPDIVMRFGHGPALPMSPRRNVDSVIDA